MAVTDRPFAIKMALHKRTEQNFETWALFIDLAKEFAFVCCVALFSRLLRLQAAYYGPF